jgi:hypothetical protein
MFANAAENLHRQLVDGSDQDHRDAVPQKKQQSVARWQPHFVSFKIHQIPQISIFTPQ